MVLMCLLIHNRHVLSFEYKIFNPISTIVYFWMMVFICHYYYWGSFNSFNLLYWLIVSGIFTLSCGFWLSYSVPIEVDSTFYEYNPFFLEKYIQLFIFSSSCLLIYYIDVIVIGLAHGNWVCFFDNTSTSIRYAYLSYQASVTEKVFTFLLGLISYLGYVILAIYVSKKLPKRGLYFFIVLLIELLISIVTMSKLSFSMFLLSFFLTYINNLPTLYFQKKALKRLFPVLLLFLIGFFVFIGFQRNYMETKGGLEEGVLNGIVNYFAGSLEAFRIVVDNGVDISKLKNGMLDIGRAKTNVYTWFFYFYKAFSYVGILVFPFLIGVVSGRLYKPWKRSFFFDVSNTWIIVIFAFSFFDFLLKFTIFQTLFLMAWWIDKRFNKYIYE